MTRTGEGGPSSDEDRLLRPALVGWVLLLGVAVVLTAATHLLWGDLRLRIAASPALVVGEVLVVVLLIALIMIVGRYRRNADRRCLRRQIQEEARMQHRHFLRRLDH